MASQATAGAETRVNSYTASDQLGASVTALADGGWVVTWMSLDQDGSGYGIYQQRYDAAGAAVGAESPVNTYTTGTQNNDSVTALADGGWIVTWSSYGQDGNSYGVYQQRYNAAGAAVGAETLVNTTTTDDQSGASVTALADGGWVVTWRSAGQDGDGYGIYQQRYDAAGASVGAETLVNTYTTGEQNNASVTALADGGWVVTWLSYDQDGDGYGIYQQRYGAAGAAVGAETLVNAYTTSYQVDASVTALADGGWVVNWQSGGQDGSDYGIYQQRYDAAGAAVGAETPVNTTTTDYQGDASVIALADGGWVVTWVSFGQDGSGSGIYQQRYDAAGAAVGSETLVNTYTTSNQYNASVTALPDGGWVVTWQSNGQDGDGYGVYQRHYATDIRGSAQADTLTGTAWGEYLIGYAGNDTLDGGRGADVLVGGHGNDLYIVDNPGDDVQELPGQGIDTVRASASFSLVADGAVENMVLTGSASIDGTGNSLANKITGNTGANSISGGAGNDTLLGGAGNDMLGGGSGNDWLDGGVGADQMSGGAGDDSYVVDNAADQVFEAASGNDAVYSSLRSYSLSLNVENLVLTGSGAINGSGNGLANKITGNAGANSISGGGGNDTLVGGAGNDTLDGGAGNDSMTGGTGNDTYVVNVSGDRVVEAANGGADSVRSSISYALGANAEKLVLTGSSNLNGSGNSLGNTITGNAAANKLGGAAGNDTLGGGAGNDVLTGGAGSDRLSGGAGRDIFQFDSKTGSDTITDFRSVDDTFRFSQAGLRIGDGDTTVDGFAVRNASGGFSAATEVVVFTPNAGSLTPAGAAAVIGSAASSFAKGATRLFVVDDGGDSGIFLFTSSSANEQVSASELTLIATVNGTSTAASDYVFAA